MKILELPDLHFPFTDMKRIAEVHKFNKHYKADYVYQSGDMFDFYGLTRFVKSPKAPNLPDEIEACKPQVKALAKMFPKLRILKGNHEARLHKRAVEAGIDSGFIKTIWERIGKPSGWSLAPDEGEIRDGTFWTHGTYSTRKAHALEYGLNVAIGHLHGELGIDFIKRNISSNNKIVKREAFFVLCVGVICDRKALAFEYSSKELDKWTQGFGGVTHGKPFVESLE